MIFRTQIAFQFDSALPRDRVVITPHFLGDNPSALANALKTNINADPNVGATVPYTIKVYDAEKAPPNYPIAEVTNGTGFLATTHPRELALCLSYYSGFNRKRLRGRLYIPVTFLPGTLGLRPSATAITACENWGNILHDGLPSGHQWMLWSRVDRKANTVSDWWVDDEWDIMRSRGLRGTTRTTGALASDEEREAIQASHSE